MLSAVSTAAAKKKIFFMLFAFKCFIFKTDCKITAFFSYTYYFIRPNY